MRINEVAFQLLQHYDENQEQKRLGGRFHQQQKRADCAADERAHNGHQRRESRERADHQRVRHAEQEHTQRA